MEQLEDRTLLSNYSAATVSDLIADINAANQAGGTNTITLAVGQTFTINQVNNTTDFGNGLPVIATNDNLTIAGHGDTIQRDKKSAAFRLFEVAGGASLTLMDLTLQNGLASAPIGSGAALGGGVLNYGTLMVSGCTLSTNTANGNGGGIFNFGSLTVSGCTLSSNSAGKGGGIFNAGTATVQSSTLSYNSVDGGFGGGIYNFFTMTVSGCTVDHNSASLGGGIYHDYGGGGWLTINSCTVSHNSAQDGGGIYDGGYALTISNSLVCGNTAHGFGGDLYVVCGFGLPTITNSTVCDIFFARCA